MNDRVVKWICQLRLIPEDFRIPPFSIVYSDKVTIRLKLSSLKTSQPRDPIGTFNSLMKLHQHKFVHLGINETNYMEDSYGHGYFVDVSRILSANHSPSLSRLLKMGIPQILLDNYTNDRNAIYNIDLYLWTYVYRNYLSWNLVDGVLSPLPTVALINAKLPSFDPLPQIIWSPFIIANYHLVKLIDVANGIVWETSHGHIMKMVPTFLELETSLIFMDTFDHSHNCYSPFWFIMPKYQTFHNNRDLFTSRADKVARDVSEFLQSFHKTHLHNDIKIDNIVYDQANDKFLLIDYGLVLNIDSPKPRINNFIHYYQICGILTISNIFTIKGDYELLRGTILGLKHPQIYEDICNGSIPNYQSYLEKLDLSPVDREILKLNEIIGECSLPTPV